MAASALDILATTAEGAYNETVGPLTKNVIDKMMPAMTPEDVSKLVKASPDVVEKATKALVKTLKRESGEIPRQGRQPGVKYGPYKPREELADDERCAGTKGDHTRCTLSRQDGKNFCKHHDPEVDHTRKTKKRKSRDSDSDSGEESVKRTRKETPEEKRCLGLTVKGRCTLGRKSDSQFCGHHDGNRKMPVRNADSPLPSESPEF